MEEKDAGRADEATRRAALIHDLETRLRSACAGWPPELFKSMIEGLADVTIRYDGHASISTYDRRTTDRLVADLKDALARNEQGRERLGEGT